MTKEMIEIHELSEKIEAAQKKLLRAVIGIAECIPDRLRGVIRGVQWEKTCLDLDPHYAGRGPRVEHTWVTERGEYQGQLTDQLTIEEAGHLLLLFAEKLKHCKMQDEKEAGEALALVAKLEAALDTTV